MGTNDSRYQLSSALAAKLNQITEYLEDMQDSIHEINEKIDIGFFEAKYNEYINKIM